MDREAEKVLESGIGYSALLERRRSSSRISIIQNKILSLQICAPDDMSIEDVTKEVNWVNPSGTSAGWVYKEDLGKAKCAEREGYYHVVFVC